MRALVLTGLLLLGGCASPEAHAPDVDSSLDAPSTSDATAPALPWTAAFDPPLELDTARVHLEPLAPRHTDLDHAALMGSREHLRRTLRWGEWPREDFTADENREDLERHWQEFVDREGYAYTVQSPDRSTCLGCVYLVPFPGGAPDVAMLAYWVVEPELAHDLDAHLLRSLLDWFERDWTFRRVVVAETDGNPRGRQLALDTGMTPADDEFTALLSQRPDMAGFMWERDG